MHIGLFYIVAILIVLAIRYFSERGRERRIVESLYGGPLRLAIPTEPYPHASIYDEIVRQASELPTGPLDYERFPKIPFDNNDGLYAPGARIVLRARFPNPQPTGWQRIFHVQQAVSKGTITDWRVLEQNVIDVEPDDNIEIFLSRLQPNDVSPKAAALFLTMAERSGSYRGVIWGITVGSINLQPGNINRLVTLGRHSELTTYVGIALRREAIRDNEFEKVLLDLQEVAYDWGALQATHMLLNLESTASNPDRQRRIVLNAMKNGDFLRTELASMLIEQGMIDDMVELADDDAPLREALVDLVESVTLHPEAPGPLVDVPTAEALVERFTRAAERWPADITTLVLLRSIGIFLTFEEKVKWQRREEQLEEIRRIYFDQLSLDAIKDAITDDHRRRTALAMVVELEATDLLPEVLDDFQKRPGRNNIDVLGRLGNRGHLRAMLDAIPEIVNLDARPHLEWNAATADGEVKEDRASYLYASIVTYLGRLGTPEAIDRVRSAGRDPHPWARTAAMQALGSLQRWTLDKSSRELVRICLDDEIDYVREAARTTAEFHQLNASLKGSSYTPSFPVNGPMN